MADLRSFPMASPSDMRGLAAALDAGELLAEDIQCVFVKTEGNGLGNDYTRELAEDHLLALLSSRLSLTVPKVAERICVVCSGGTEGVISPHMSVLSVSTSALGPVAAPRLAFGRASVAPVSAQGYCTLEQVHAVEEAVQVAMAQGGIRASADVHFVLVKAALPKGLVSAAMQQAKPGLRAACALGVACALGEVSSEHIYDCSIGREMNLFSTRACVTAAAGQSCSEILLLGNSEQWGGTLVCGHTMLSDMLDSPAVAELLRSLGLNPMPQLSRDQSARVRGVFLKGEPPQLDLRGERHAMWSDSDINALRHYRAAMGGMLSAVFGSSRFYLSAGAEHQGIPGGACLSVIIEEAAIPTTIASA